MKTPCSNVRERGAIFARPWARHRGLLSIPLAALGAASTPAFAGDSPSPLLAVSSLWESHPELLVAAIAAILVQAASITGLLIHRARCRRSEQSLRTSEERYRGIVESQSEMVCRYRPDSILTFVNEAYCRYFGKTREELVGHSFLNLIPPASHDEMRKVVASLINTGQRVTTEHQVLHRDGSIGWHHWEDYVVEASNGNAKEIQAIGHDITDRKLAEIALRINEDRMFLAAEAANLVFWRWDVTTDEMWMTGKWRELFGLGDDALPVYTTILHQVHPDDRPVLQSTLSHAASAGHPFESEYRVQLPNGGLRWLASRGRWLPGREGSPAQMVGVSMDITARRHAEETTETLVHAARLALVGEMTASIAHEMNQPLGAILSNAEAAELLLDLNPLPLHDVRQILSDIRKDDLRASNVIRQLRALLRKRPLQIQPANIHEIATDAINLAANEARRRKVTIDTAFAAQPAEIRCDRVHLQQVFLNLILNGMDAMSATAGNEKRLLICTESQREKLQIAVKDAGHGIAPDRLPKVFDSFFTTKADGMGLGLSIARSIVEMHKGTIWAENNGSEPGVTFYFTLPHLM